MCLARCLITPGCLFPSRDLLRALHYTGHLFDCRDSPFNERITVPHVKTSCIVTNMFVARLLKKFGQTSLARPPSTSPDAGGSPSANDSGKSPHRQQVSEPTLTIPRPWKKKRSSAIDHSGVSWPTSTSSSTPDTNDPTSLHGEREISLQMPVPTNPIVLTTTTMDPPPENINQVQDKITEAWEAVRNDPKATNTSRGLDAADDIAATAQNYAARLIPVVKATVAAVQQTDVGKAMKEGINKFSESMPIFMKALDEVKSLHPVIGVAVLAFQTVYTLEQKRHDNDKKITSLFVGMRDMMGALFLLKNMENDKLVAPDGISIEDRLRSLVDRTADDIKMCSNVCDAYMKKRLLAKVLMSPVWDAKLLDFVKLFATRRQEFEFELTMHTSQGVDKANLKLDTIGEATRALNEQMNSIKTLFEQLANPEQKRLSELLAAKGGVKALKEDDKVLLELERAAGKASGAPKGDLGRTRRDQPMDTNSSANDLRRDIFEDPNVAVENNLIVFSRKFEAQRNQIVHELTLVVKRESDRVIQEVKGGPHERILDRSVHEIWTEMAWRGNVKARYFVLALRDHYLEKLASGAENIVGMGTARAYSPPDPDAWAIKYIDIMRLQPIQEAIDDDASGFITIGEINRFTASRPIDWSLPHWVAFWAVGYKASIIDYSHKIEELFAKMDRIRTKVLPLNRHAIITYFAYIWVSVHSLIAPLLSLQPGQDELEKYKSHLESEEARLENNLKAVDYIIDGTDTLTLITGVGRIEKTVFPLVYLMMKRHYEVMRIMRTKVLDLREVLEIANSMFNIQEAINYRVDDLTYSFSQQKLDIDKQFQTFAYGIFTYFKHTTAVWSRDHMLGLDHQATLYDNLDEDQSVKIENILRFESLDEMPLDYWVYDGHSIDDIPDYGNVEPPLKDILGHWHGYFYESGGVRETVGTDSMMTLVLEPPDGERNFKANGWSIRGRFTVTGSWSIDENGLMKIKFKISFPFRVRYVVPIFFNGYFDPIHNALTGVWGYSAEIENTMGLLEFRRIPPCYLTVYPSIKELSDNRSRALWRFAIAAVRNDIRQRWCPWSYFAHRRDDRETVVSLAVRSQLFGKPLDGEEAERLCAAAQRLTPADACFYGSIIFRQRASTLTHENLLCDACEGRIGGARLICLDCIDQSNTFYTIDLCCAPESRCIDERVTSRDDLAGPHEPFHKLIKLRAAVPTHRLGRTYNLACAAFERVEDFLAKVARISRHSQEQKESEAPSVILVEEDGSRSGTEIGPTVTEMLSKSDRLGGTSVDVGNTRDRVEEKPTVTEVSEKNDSARSTTDDANDQDETEHNVSQATTQAQRQDEDIPGPTCGECNKSLSFPLWYCIYCEDNLFICEECDARGVPDLMRSSGRHTEEHHLIRCLKPETDDKAVSPPEQRLFSIEGRLADMQTQFADMQTQFADMQTQFADIQTQSKAQFNDLAARIGNIEELLRKLAGTSRSD